MIKLSILFYFNPTVNIEVNDENGEEYILMGPGVNNNLDPGSIHKHSLVKSRFKKKLSDVEELSIDQPTSVGKKHTKKDIATKDNHSKLEEVRIPFLS